MRDGEWQAQRRQPGPWSRRVSSAICALALVLAPIGARADDPVARQVERLAADANAAYKAYDFQRAVDLLERAFQLRQVPALIYNLAKAYERLGDQEKAVEYYRRYVASGEADPKLKAKAETRIQVYEDSKTKRDPIRPEPVEPKVGQNPVVVVVVPPQVPAESEDARRLRLWKERRRRDRRTGIALASVAGGLALVGVGLSIGASVEHSRYTGSLALESDKRQLRDVGRALAISSDVLYGVAAINAGVAIYYLYRGFRKEAPPTSARLELLAPTVSATSAGLVAGGVFRSLACAMVLLSGCTAVLDFDQCTQDSDCLALSTNGSPAYCTLDRICVSDYPDDRICALDVVSSTRTDAVTIGGLFRLTGPNEVKDTDLARAVELAVDEINQAGTRGLRLVLCDTGGNPEQARKALLRAVQYYGAVAVVGPTSSSEVVALARQGDSLVTSLDVLVVSSSSTAPAITTLDDDNLVWRTAASDTLQTRVLSTLVPPMTTRVASAYVNSTYGSGLNAAFTNALGEAFDPPLSPVGKAFDEGTPGDEVTAFLESSTPEIALIVADSDAPVWIAALDRAGPDLAATRFLLTDGSKSPSLFSMNPSPALLGRISGTAPATPSGPAFNAFKGIYEGTYQSDPAATAFVANAYDATYAIAIAMGAIPPSIKVSGRLLAEGMKRLSDPGGMRFNVGAADFATAYGWLADGGVVDLQGTSGPIDFDADSGDILSAPIEIWEIDSTQTPPIFVSKKIVTP